MVNIERFEDLEAWKKARETTKAIYAATSGGKFSRDFSLRDQIRRETAHLIGGLMRYLRESDYKGTKYK
jgi:hypothetical protein